MKTNKDRKLVRDVILEYVEEYVNSFNYGMLYKISVEGRTLDIEEIKTIILDNIVNDDGSRITGDELQHFIQLLKENECFEFKEDMLKIVKVPLDYKLKHKYNIAIDTIKDNISKIAVATGGIVVVSSMIVGGIYFSNQRNEQYDRYQNSILVDNEKNYHMKDIYVVYSSDNVYFCTRSMHKITEDDKVYGNFRFGGGNIDEYYYRDEIYDYYDIKTGKKICSDHQDGFYIEGLLDFYGMNKMSEKNYQISLEEITNDIDNDYLLSRDPGLRRK